MSKPSTLPTWDTNGTNSTVPSAGKQTDGWPAGPSSPVISSYLNYWMNLVYLWIAWLNGLWGADGSLTMDTNASITVSGTGQYKHPTRTIPLALPGEGAGAPTASHIGNPDAAPGTPLSLDGAGGFNLQCLIPLAVGKRIKEVRAMVTVASGTAVAKLYQQVASTGSVTLIATGSATSGSSSQFAAVTGLTTSIATGVRYWLWVTRASGSGDINVYHAECDYDEV